MPCTQYVLNKHWLSKIKSNLKHAHMWNLSGSCWSRSRSNSLPVRPDHIPTNTSGCLCESSGMLGHTWKTRDPSFLAWLQTLDKLISTHSPTSFPTALHLHPLLQPCLDVQGLCTYSSFCLPYSYPPWHPWKRQLIPQDQLKDKAFSDSISRMYHSLCAINISHTYLSLL